MPGKPALVISAAAERQISDIWQRVAADTGIAVADRIYEGMRAVIADLPSMPLRHESRDYVRRHYRRALVERWAIYYRYEPGGRTVEVIAIFDGAMDVERHLPPE